MLPCRVPNVRCHMVDGRPIPSGIDNLVEEAAATIRSASYQTKIVKLHPLPSIRRQCIHSCRVRVLASCDRVVRATSRIEIEIPHGAWGMDETRLCLSP